ncbi:unnamed protein product [Linum tenue]|uniref:ZCF37 n=1 Tax=Linum tenue TaxID=586396 RepID=A0AAV0P153_9ROSI|nr:unnamed protein product [Linum tenue]
MLSPLICGASFQTDEDDLPCGAASSSPSPRKPWGGRRGGRNNNNPYSGRGLDKFSQLLSDLAEKRREIYSTMSSQDPPLVRFVFPGATSDAVPVVIKIRDPKPSKSAELKDHPHHNHNHRNLKHSNSAASAAAAEQAVTNSTPDQQHKLPAVGEIVEESWRRPSVYVPVAVILILLFLAVFGRSVAILCTSIGWYLVPTLTSKRPEEKKKEYVRKLSGPRATNATATDHGGISSASASTATSPKSGNVKRKEYTRKFSEIKTVNEGTATPPAGSPPRKELKHRKSF